MMVHDSVDDTYQLVTKLNHLVKLGNQSEIASEAIEMHYFLSTLQFCTVRLPPLPSLAATAAMSHR